MSADAVLLLDGEINALLAEQNALRAQVAALDAPIAALQRVRHALGGEEAPRAKRRSVKSQPGDGESPQPITAIPDGLTYPDGSPVRTLNDAMEILAQLEAEGR